VQGYLERLGVWVEGDWQAATQRGWPLTEARARRLIAQGEGERVEFKESLTSQLRRAAVETLAAFAAKHGGTVFFGVRDDGTLRGVQVGQQTLEKLAREIESNTDPPLTAPHLRVALFQFAEGTVVAASVDSMQRECRAYGRVCRRVGRQTWRR
jgi:ATP-dependent DNA helicase RecG